MSVCLSVRPSVTSRCSTKIAVGSPKERHTIAQGVQVSDAKDLGERFDWSYPEEGHHIQAG